MGNSVGGFAVLPRLESVKTVERSVYDSLKSAIIQARLSPGQKLVTAKIAEELGVSRMPVREAIQRLEAEGFVTVKPFRGAEVTQLSWQDIREIYDIRMVLEGYAMKLAMSQPLERKIEALESLLRTAKEKVASGDLAEIEEIDDKFHKILFSTCGSSRLEGLLRNLWEQCSYFRSVAALLRRDPLRSIRQHEELIEVLRTRDVERAVEAVQAHTQVSRDTLISYLKNEHSENQVDGEYREVLS
ncbi:MAG: GntR family transcriptional regulator [Firmicutes bacterium]|jgi:DNA-binding GntR family transcriptional regulator|nr:GntR family transcriptional regulator [Bacillota bacterium]